LTLTEVIFDSNWIALLFPWRLSIFIVSLSVTTILAVLVTNILKVPAFDSNKSFQALLIASSIFLFLTILTGGIRFKLDLDRKISQPERSVQEFILKNHSPGDTYLIPVKMQDFRLVADAPAYVDFKSIPYKDTDVIEWYHRERLADRFYKSKDCTILQELAVESDITHVILEVEEGEINCHSLEKRYQDDYYYLMQIHSP
jgi:hypothetical protein